MNTIRTALLIWFPSHKNNFIEKVVPPRKRQFMPLITLRVLLFRFLYFYPLEDDLDLDEEGEVEEERR